MHELMFQAVSRCESLKGMNERCELIPCKEYTDYYNYPHKGLIMIHDMYMYIIESVDSISRDGPDCPYM